MQVLEPVPARAVTSIGHRRAGDTLAEKIEPLCWTCRHADVEPDLDRETRLRRSVMAPLPVNTTATRRSYTDCAPTARLRSPLIIFIILNLTRAGAIPDLPLSQKRCRKSSGTWSASIPMAPVAAINERSEAGAHEPPAPMAVARWNRNSSHLRPTLTPPPPPRDGCSRCAFSQVRLFSLAGHSCCIATRWNADRKRRRTRPILAELDDFRDQPTLRLWYALSTEPACARAGRCVALGENRSLVQADIDNPGRPN